MRINIIDPKLLADQHLRAEYREIKMLPKMMLKSYNTSIGIQFNRISKTYTLNKGHGYFFYNKIKFIENRFKLILEEMQNRGFKTDFTNLDLQSIHFHPSFYNDYKPTLEEQKTNVERILLRINQKPQWYLFKGLKIKDWSMFYNEYSC